MRRWLFLLLVVTLQKSAQEANGACFDCCAGFAAAGFLFGPLLGPGERIVTAEPARWVQIQPTPWEGASPAQAGSGSSFEEEECRQAEVADGGLG